MTRSGLIYLASFVAHGALAAGIVSLKAARTHEDVAISVVESPKAKQAEKPPPEAPPPPPEPPRPAAERRAKAAIAKSEAPPPEAPSPAANAGSDVPDFGLALGGSGGGLAVAARPAAPAPSASAEHVSKKVLAAAPPSADECSEPLKKPKVVTITQPDYTADARDARIAGKVRVEVTVDATGKVASSRVLEGLGYGLDEAALAAARAATFEPGTKCGKATNATFVIAIRFTL